MHLTLNKEIPHYREIIISEFLFQIAFESLLSVEFNTLMSLKGALKLIAFDFTVFEHTQLGFLYVMDLEFESFVVIIE